MLHALKMKVVVTVLLCGTLVYTGCSANWISEAQQIVAVLIPATANLVTLVATVQGDVSSADLQTVQSVGAQAGADLQLTQSLIAQYQKADASAQPGLLRQIQASISSVQTNLNGLLSALHIKDTAMRTKITAVVGILLTEVQSVAAVVPIVNPNASAGMVRMATTQAKKQVPLSANELAGSYNAMMTAKTGNGNLDHATAGLTVHAHGKLARWASAGLLK
jgi:hypothetical protein